MIPAYIEEEACIRVQLAAKKSLKQLKDDFIAQTTARIVQEQCAFISSAILQHITVPAEQEEAGTVEEVKFPVLEESLPELDWQGLENLEAVLNKLQETAHY